MMLHDYSNFFQPDFNSVVKEDGKYFVYGEGFDPYLNQHYEDMFVLEEGAFVRSDLFLQGKAPIDTAVCQFHS